MTKKKLISQLRDLVCDPEHQRALLNNAKCLKSLASMLNSDDDEVVQMTVETLYACSHDPVSSATLCEVPTLIDTLYTLSIEHANPSIRLKSGRLVCNLDSGSSSSSSTYLTSLTSQRRCCKQLHVISLEVEGMESCENRERFHQDAVRLSGIVSITLRGNMKRATVYTSEPNMQDHVVNYLRCKGWTVSLRERTNSISIDENECLDKDPHHQPAYLNPEVVKVEVLGKHSLGYYRPSKNAESLSQRIARYKREQAEGVKKEKQSLFSSVVNFFW